MPEPRQRKRVQTTSERIDQTAPAYVVIVTKWGGLAPFCEDTGWPKSTVHDWLVKGLIPADRQERLLELAQQFRKRVKPADLVPVPKAA